MHLRQLSRDEILATVSADADAFLGPFREALDLYAQRTEIIREPWSQSFGTTSDGRLSLYGFPLHPHLEARMLNALLGVGPYKQSFWGANPDLAAEAMNRTERFRGASVEARVIDGQVVYLTELLLEYGHHRDFFDVMATRYSRLARHGTVTVTMVGYLLDPAWAHLRLLFIPSRPATTIYLGVSLDVNYLFSRCVRGRASYGLFGYSFERESMLTLDDYWSLRCPPLHTSTDPALLPAFEQRLENGVKRTRARLATHQRPVRRWNMRRTPTPWKQKLIADFGNDFCGADRVRTALIDLEREGRNSPVDLAFSLATLVRESVFKRRIVAERVLANRLKRLMGGRQ